MKTFIAALLWSVTAFLATVTAAERATGSIPRIEVGKPFSFKVVSVETWRIDKSGITTSGGPVPAGMPKYKIGETITFEIAKNHNLTWKRHSVPFHNYSFFTRANFYEGTNRNTTTFAVVYLNSKKNPTFMSLTFYRTTKSGIYHHLAYQLQ